MVIDCKGLCITFVFAGIFQSAYSAYYSFLNTEEMLIYLKVHRNWVFLKSHTLFKWKIEWNVQAYVVDTYTVLIL